MSPEVGLPSTSLMLLFCLVEQASLAGAVDIVVPASKGNYATRRKRMVRLHLPRTTSSHSDLCSFGPAFL